MSFSLQALRWPLALALGATVGCSFFSSEPEAPPPPKGLEVFRVTEPNGVVRYTIQRADGETTSRGVLAPIEANDNRPSIQSAPPSLEQETPVGPAPEPPAASPESPVDAPAPEASAEVPGSPIAEIRRQVETDRELLREMIGRTEGGASSDDPRLRAIADRLPRLQAELEALENESTP